MQRLAMALLGLAFATGAQAQSLKEKYELSEQRFEKAPSDECIFGRGHGISCSIRLRHQHRNRPPTPTPRPRPSALVLGSMFLSTLQGQAQAQR